MLDHKRDLKAWFYLAIPLFLMSIFTFYPLVKTLLISVFSEYNPLTDDFGRYFDFYAYLAVFNDRFFIQSLSNSMVLVFVSVPISTILALLIAVALNSIKGLQKIFQTIFSNNKIGLCQIPCKNNFGLQSTPRNQCIPLRNTTILHFIP